uniref:Uncharacterized protein n=1 Tax=Romanomermis culicivorax TaxID=13658 RepID=A0A915HN36_ROMCU
MKRNISQCEQDFYVDKNEFSEIPSFGLSCPNEVCSNAGIKSRVRRLNVHNDQVAIRMDGTSRILIQSLYPFLCAELHLFYFLMLFVINAILFINSINVTKHQKLTRGFE